jgi:LysR family glycine cleavage system transcriptional activator
MRISHLNALRALEATLRLGSFTKAARELGITPAAAGQRVRLLEEYLGVVLFERSGAGIRPTTKAQDVEKKLTEGFINIALALKALSPKSSSESLRITLPESFAENWLTPALTGLYEQYPNLNLYLEPTNRDVDLEAEDFDLTIRYGKSSGKHLEDRVLFGDRIIPICSPGFADRHGLRPDQRSLKGVPLIFVANRTKDPGWVGFEDWGTAFGFDPAHLGHGVRISKTGSGLQAAIAGQGLVLCGLVEAFNALKAGLLVLPFGPSVGYQTRYAYRLVWAKSRLDHENKQPFIDWIVAKSEAFVSDLENYLKGA